MKTNTMKNQYTFSGQDVHVYVYRDLSRLISREKVNQGAKSRQLQLEMEAAKAQKRADDRAKQLFSNPTAPVNPALVDQWHEDLSAQKGFEERGKAIQSDLASFNSGTKAEDKVDMQKLLEYGEGFDNSTALGGTPFTEIGMLDTLSYSSFREKIAVRSLGRSNSIGYTRGARTIAGSMVFNAVQENELLAFAKQVEVQDKAKGTDPQKILIDQIDPFHMILIFSNEYGSYSAMNLFNVEIASESQRMSINDIVIQNAMNFYATDILPMEHVGDGFNSTFDMLQGIANKVHKDKGVSGMAALRKKLDRFGQDPKVAELLSRSRGLF